MTRLMLIMAVLCVGVFLQLNAAENSGKLPLVAIVTTGGTIAEKKDPGGAAVPTLSGKALIQAVPEIGKYARVKVYPICNEDSSRITPAAWLKVARKVTELVGRSDVAGVIVTHGTDTMAEAAFFVHLCVKTDKPVIFVGSMRNASEVSPDGPANLLNAVRQATAPNAFKWGVTVSLNNYINSALYVRKTNTANVQTFNSGERGYLGYIAMGKVLRYNELTGDIRTGLPEKLSKVEIFLSYAGSEGQGIRRAVDSGVSGIVVEGVGAGNVNKKVYEAIRYALRKNVIVVVTTAVPQGPALPAYGGPGGGATLVQDGAILSTFFRARKSRILLMLALSQDMNKAAIAKLFR